MLTHAKAQSDVCRTGGRISDITVLEGVLEGTEEHIFAVEATPRPRRLQRILILLVRSNQ